ncbi:MAG: hypothetical protein Q9160_001699 [Pyrenula sp. 1 TL-2023]
MSTSGRWEGGATRESEAALVEGFEEMLLGQGVLGWDVVAWDGVVNASDPGSEGANKEERNAYGEKMGLGRLMEILEAMEWASPSGLDEGGEDDPALAFLSTAGVGGQGQGEDEDEDALKQSEHELQREMMGLSLAIREQSQRGEDGMEGVGEGEDDEAAKVDALPGLMERVMAMRERGVGMEGEERERWARRAVGELMREL